MDAEGAIQLGGSGFDLMPQGLPVQRVGVRTGKVLLFPSCLFHASLPFRADTERVTIPFDLIPASGGRPCAS
jgi:hypothetical protein